MADLNKIGNLSTPVYPVKPGKPVKERESPPRRSSQDDGDGRGREEEDAPDDSHIDDFA